VPEIIPEAFYSVTGEGFYLSDMSRAPKPPRILIIEDNAADVSLLRTALDRQGVVYDLQLLNDGEAALRFVEEHRDGTRAPDPCVILLDLHIPKYDGLEVLAAIKREPVLAHIHVVVMSGLASPREQAAILAYGGLYRQKPFRWDDCLALAAEILAICKSHLETLAATVS
jgi:CheY-like chemotaxis protein